MVDPAKHGQTGQYETERLYQFESRQQVQTDQVERRCQVKWQRSVMVEKLPRPPLC